MAAVVDVWVGELAKLGEKVKIPNCVFFDTRRTRKAFESAQVMEAEVEEQSSESRVKVNAKIEDTLSESTVFMLMNAFAPS